MAALSGCGSAPVTGSRDGTAPVVRALLATSVETSSGSWATAAMGHLDQPLNTFWQLFFRPRGALAWSDQAAALAVATNGGLVLASSQGRLVVGIRAVNKLDYSPLIVTSNAHSWSPAGPIGALADEPDALAISAGGEAVALVSQGASARVLASPGRLAGWRQIATEKTLASSPAGRACGVVSLTAVGYLAGQALIGASCLRAGTVGVFAVRRNLWRLIGPSLPASLTASRAEVLGLQAATGGLCVLVAVTRQPGAELVAACTGSDELKWHVSQALPLGRDDVVSFGPTARLGLYVLTSGSAGDTLAVLTEPARRWRSLPPPPARTAAVVFGAGGRVDALAVADTTFTDWSLATGPSWQRVQEMHVPIQFGSSG